MTTSARDQLRRAAEQVAAWLRLLLEPGQVVELRALEVREGPYRPATVAGYYDFDHLDELAQKAVELTRRAEGVYFTLNPINPALLALGSLTLLPANLTQPCWLDGAGPFPADEVLAANNALVHLPSLVAERPDYSRLPTLNFFSPNALDYACDVNAPEPQEWLSFLQRVWPDDPESIRTLQEWFGYCLTPDTRQQKICMIIGPKRSGKGTLARMLRGLVGPENVAGPTLSSLGTTFGLWPLLGKTVAVISDARLSGRQDMAVIVERLLSISGEDALTVDRKHLAPVTAKLTARLLILSNELPRLSDASGALPSRLILLHMPRSWYGQEDPSLTDRLLAELPGILLWAIEGWRRLRERGHFEQPEASQELLAEVEDLSSPVGAFVKECCVVSPGRRATIEELFGRWRVWCEAAGRREPGTQQVFGRDLLAAVPGLRRVRPRDGGTRVRAYEGIGLLGQPAVEE